MNIEQFIKLTNAYGATIKHWPEIYQEQAQELIALNLPEVNEALKQARLLDEMFSSHNANQLFKLYDTFPEIERLFRKIFETAYVETVNRIEGMQFHSAEERYNALLTEAPNVLMRVPLKYVASYLGITQVSLSRIRAHR